MGQIRLAHLTSTGDVAAGTAPRARLRGHQLEQISLEGVTGLIRGSQAALRDGFSGEAERIESAVAMHLPAILLAAMADPWRGSMRALEGNGSRRLQLASVPQVADLFLHTYPDPLGHVWINLSDPEAPGPFVAPLDGVAVEGPGLERLLWDLYYYAEDSKLRKLLNVTANSPELIPFVQGRIAAQLPDLLEEMLQDSAMVAGMNGATDGDGVTHVRLVAMPLLELWLHDHPATEDEERKVGIEFRTLGDGPVPDSYHLNPWRAEDVRGGVGAIHTYLKALVDGAP